LPSIKRALVKTFGPIYLKLALFKLAWIALIWFAAFYCLRGLILFKTNNLPTEIGHYYALGLFASVLLSSLAFHHLLIQTTRVGIQCRAALMVLIYHKSLKLSYVKDGVGNIVNLISNECNRIAEAAVHWHSFWSAALHLVGFHL
jgi:hypothetical protein